VLTTSNYHNIISLSLFSLYSSPKGWQILCMWHRLYVWWNTFGTVFCAALVFLRYWNSWARSSLKQAWNSPLLWTWDHRFAIQQIVDSAHTIPETKHSVKQWELCPTICYALIIVCDEYSEQYVWMWILFKFLHLTVTYVTKLYRFLHGYQGVLFVFCVTQEDLQLGIHSLFIKTNSENVLKKQLVVL
jgi:hypothetical protein